MAGAEPLAMAPATQAGGADQGAGAICAMSRFGAVMR